LLQRHDIDPEEVAPVNAAFTAGDIQAALDATPDALADRLVVAGTPDDWVSWLTEDYVPAGLNHALISFTDPFTLESWAGRSIAGLPGLTEQVRLFGEAVLPRLP
jgi:5,10-methylenetetrahydromethanopterin reductase